MKVDIFSLLVLTMMTMVSTVFANYTDKPAKYSDGDDIFVGPDFDPTNIFKDSNDDYSGEEPFGYV